MLLSDHPHFALPCVTSPTTSETGGSAQQQNMANRCSPLLKRSDDLATRSRKKTDNWHKIGTKSIRNHTADMLLSDVLQTDSTSGLPAANSSNDPQGRQANPLWAWPRRCHENILACSILFFSQCATHAFPRSVPSWHLVANNYIPLNEDQWNEKKAIAPFQTRWQGHGPQY